MKTQLLCKYDTIYSADSVEWCPIPPYQRLFVCGNYQLSDADTTNTTDCAQQKRFGRILLFEYVNKLKLLQTINTAAVLDQKWCHNSLNKKAALAVTTAIGALDIYTLDVENPKLCHWLNYTFPPAEKERLILSVDWSTGKYVSETPQLIVSDNKGSVHLFHLFDSGLIQLKSWNLHSHEAWICAFDYWNTKCFFSGADDAIFIKTEYETSQHIKNKSHDCGVTSMHSNISHEYVLATGSYDKYVRLWDTRMLKAPQSSVEMIGPVWRVKWDPFQQNYLIAACMDGGVAVVDNTSEHSPEIILLFTEHESIAYGVDWCQEKDSRLIGSCSFYDHLLCVAQYEDSVQM